MPKTLLLADDSITIQKVVGITFANEDFEVTAVDNGEAALARARELRPDVILADVVMPRKNGYELCEAVKSDPELGHIPVLLLAGTFEAFDEARARSARADGHLAKPFESQALIDKVRELVLGLPPAERPAPVRLASAPPPNGAPQPGFAGPRNGAAQPGFAAPRNGAVPTGGALPRPPPNGAPRPAATAFRPPQPQPQPQPPAAASRPAPAARPSAPPNGAPQRPGLQPPLGARPTPGAPVPGARPAPGAPAPGARPPPGVPPPGARPAPGFPPSGARPVPAAPPGTPRPGFAPPAGAPQRPFPAPGRPIGPPAPAGPAFPGARPAPPAGVRPGAPPPAARPPAAFRPGAAAPPQARPAPAPAAPVAPADRRDPFGFDGFGTPPAPAPEEDWSDVRASIPTPAPVPGLSPQAPPRSSLNAASSLEARPPAPIELPELDGHEIPDLAPPHAFVPPAATTGHAPEPQAARPGQADGGEAVLREALSRASREVIERVVWEVVPELAEAIIRENLDRLVKQRQG